MSLLDPTLSLDRLPSPGFLPRDEDFVELLRSPDFDTRLQTLNRAMSMARRDQDWFTRFQKKGELFKSIDRILFEDRWEVQHQCIRFLIEAMPTFGSGLEYCICYVLPNIIPKLGSTKITVRRVSVQLLQAYLRINKEALGSVLKIMTNYLTNSPDRLTKGEVITEIPALFIPEVTTGNWANLMDGLTKCLSGTESDYCEKIATTGKKLEGFIGKDAFAVIIQSLTEQQQRDYGRYAKDISIEEQQAPGPLLARLPAQPSGAPERRFRFGILPVFVSAMITDEDATQRIAGLEKLKQIIEKLSPEDMARLIPHLHSFLITLGHVLSDLNFKVVVLALDVLRLTVNRLKTHMDAHLQQVVSLISKHLGNQKAVIKQLLMMTSMDLFHNLNPKTVVGAFSPLMENRNSRVREEVVNILTSAMMMISASKFNFTAVINLLVPSLVDPKRRVRLAAFELLSVVVYLLNGKSDSLLRSVRETEQRIGASGLALAVQARMKRQLLPRIRYDGLIEYSTPPLTEASFDVNDSDLSSSANLDLKWILQYGGGDSNERSNSPVATTISVKPPRIEKTLLPWEEKDDTPSYPTLDRMRSDDIIIRRQDFKMGTAASRTQSATYRSVRVQPIRNVSSSLQNVQRTSAISNPSSSTNSWHAPTRRKNSEEDRTHSIAINNRMNKTVCKLDTSLDKVRLNADVRKHELNNNTLTQDIAPKKKNKVAPVSLLSKARSEGNLSEEAENLPPPANHDEAPIRPAKNAAYTVEEYGGQNGFSTQVKKSASHHSLPITGHAPLQNSQSIPSKRSHAFLKSGSNNRTKQPSQPNTRQNSNTNINQNSATVVRSKSTSEGNVQSALKLISSEEWNDKVDGLTMITDLSTSNPKQINDNMQAVFVAVITECKNLRSSVSRVALSCLGILFQNMKGKTDGEVEKSCIILMQQAGNVSNAFIREDASEALEKVAQHATPTKAMQGIISAGSKSKHNTIRTSCAQFVCSIVDRMGTTAVLNSENVAKLVPQLIAFSKDQYPPVRQHGRQCLITLSQDTNFDRSMRKNVNESEYKAVKEILGHIEKKGGLDALDCTSISLNSSLNRSGSVRKAVPRKLADSAQLDLDECRNDLNAAGWEKRLGGLRRFEEMANSTPKVVASDTRLIEAFIARLSDINSKVSLEALDCHIATLPVMSKQYSSEAHLKAVLNQLVLALMSHLSSKSEDHRHLAMTSLKETIRQIDGSALSPAMAAATKKANVKQKPYMLQMLNVLNQSLYPSRPKQVEVSGLPILFDSVRIGMADQEVKKAVTEYARGMCKLMGERALMDQATMELDPPRRKILEAMLQR